MFKQFREFICGIIKDGIEACKVGWRAGRDGATYKDIEKYKDPNYQRPKESEATEAEKPPVVDDHKWTTCPPWPE